MAIATFWRTFRHDRKIGLAWIHCISTMMYKVVVYNPPISTLPLHVLCGRDPREGVNNEQAPPAVQRCDTIVDVKNPICT